MALLTLAQASQILARSQRSIKRDIQEGRLAYIRLGRLLRFRPDDLDAYIDAHRVAPTLADPGREQGVS